MRFPAIPAHRYLFVILCLALSACGGGSGGGTGPEVTGPVPVPLPLGHGLTAGEITVAPGQSKEHGNVVVSCPTGGQNCVLNVAADGSASYDGTRGEPSIMSALATQALPPGHGLTAGEITVTPGQSMEHGNVVVSCPAGGQACVLNVAADGSASYERTGGMPSIMPALATQALPPGHGLGSGEISIAPGQSMEHGNVVVSCPAGGPACVLNVTADGSASYDRTGGMPALRILPLMAGPGLKLSDASPVFAEDETSTLKAMLGDPANVFPVLSTNLNRHREPSPGSVELSTDIFVKSIRRDASGAYVIDYVLDGADEQVTIPLDNCPRGCRTRVNGRTFGLYGDTNDDDDMATTEDGLGEFDYVAAHFAFYQPDDTQRRVRWVFGVRNEALPMGTATYHGRLYGDTWLTTDSDSDFEQRISGTVRIVANFDMRALAGRIYGIRGSEPGDSARTVWPTSSFTLTNGRIVNGQFTATLTGVDSDPNTPLDESVRGFMGHVLGEFYGPNAEEVGGVVSATRDLAGTADDRVLNAYIAGRKPDRLTGVNDSEALLSGVDRDFEADSTALTAVERPTVESTADGYRITYVVDGQAQTVELSDSDFGSRPTGSGGTTRYDKTDGPYKRYILWDPTDAFVSRRSFEGRFRPEHFDVNGLAIVHSDVSDNNTSASYNYLVSGNRTTDMPTTGTASYAGGFYAREWPTDQAVDGSDPSATVYRGDLDLSADFGRSTVTGSATGLESRPGNSRTYVNLAGGLNFNATISGNGLSATDLSGSGDLAGYSGGRVNGAFYGPGAAEVAGVLDATDGAQNKALIGYFGGQKQ